MIVKKATPCVGHPLSLPRSGASRLQNRYDFQAYSHAHFPADFEIAFAHEAIDQGVDGFVAHGVHTLKGVEIYRAKPIFYGISNFIFQSAIMPRGKGTLPAVRGSETRQSDLAEGFPGRPGARDRGESPDPDAIVGEHETQGFWQLKPTLEAILAYSHFEHGRLTEVRLYPVDLGQTPRVGTQVGVPKKPTAEVARKILDEVMEYSKPFGTRITVKDGVSIIRIAERK